MLEVKIAEEKDLNFIKDTYKLLDSKMTDLLKQLMDIGEDEDEISIPINTGKTLFMKNQDIS